MSCKYCFNSETSSDYFVLPCSCKDPLHISCFLEWYRSHPTKCLVCEHGYYRLNEIVNVTVPVYSDIFFPEDGIYPDLSGHQILQKYTKIEDQIYMAIAFLQIHHLELLLQKIPSEKLPAIFKIPSIRRLIRVFVQGSVPSGYPFAENTARYNQILNILYHYVPAHIVGYDQERVQEYFRNREGKHRNPFKILFDSFFKN